MYMQISVLLFYTMYPSYLNIYLYLCMLSFPWCTFRIIYWWWIMKGTCSSCLSSTHSLSGLKLPQYAGMIRFSGVSWVQNRKMFIINDNDHDHDHRSSSYHITYYGFHVRYHSWPASFPDCPDPPCFKPLPCLLLPSSVYVCVYVFFFFLFPSGFIIHVHTHSVECGAGFDAVFG